MSDENVIEKVLTYIDDHIEEELSLDTIAAVFNYSKFYMARIFAKEQVIQFISISRAED